MNRSVQVDSQSASLPPVGHHTWEENAEDNNTPPSGDTDERPSKRARVEGEDKLEDGSDQGFQPTGVNFIVDYPAEACAGAVLDGQGDGIEGRFEKIKREQQKAGKQPWEPFSSLADWELSRWLIQSGVSQ